MNYHLHYSHLIKRAKAREIIGYFEKHHIVPKCLGGLDDLENIVKLTAEEHFVAHQLLVKMHPGNHSLIKAMNMMCVSSSGQVRNNKRYSWIRRQFAIAKSEMQKGKPRSDETKLKISNTLMGHSVSEETRLKISKKNKGKSHPHDSETKERISKALTGRKGTRLGKCNSDEHKKRISESIKEWHKNRKKND